MKPKPSRVTNTKMPPMKMIADTPPRKMRTCAARSITQAAPRRSAASWPAAPRPDGGAAFSGAGPAERSMASVSLGMLAAQELDQIAELRGDVPRQLVEGSLAAAFVPLEDHGAERDLAETRTRVAVETDDEVELDQLDGELRHRLRPGAGEVEAAPL